MKFIHPTTAQLLKFASFFLVIVNTVLAFGATIHTVPGISPALAVYWPVIYGVAFSLHQLASNFGITPDATFAAQVGNVVQGAQWAYGSVKAAQTAIDQAKLASGTGVVPASLTPALSAIEAIAAKVSDPAAYQAGVNIAKRGDQLPDDASDSARAGFASVSDSERGKYDANGNLK